MRARILRESIDSWGCGVCRVIRLKIRVMIADYKIAEFAASQDEARSIPQNRARRV